MRNQVIIKKKISSYQKIIEVSGDKSLSIRCVLMASQAIGKSRISNLLESEDVLNSLKAIKKLGINYIKLDNQYIIDGYGLGGYKINKDTIINAGNSGTLARLLLGLLVDINKEVTIIGDKSLSKRDFSRVTDPLKLFGANIKSKNNLLPVKILGSNFLRPIKYYEKLGSAQCKTAVMLAALKSPGKTIIFAKKSRNHSEILFRNLKIPTKIKRFKKNDYIEILGQKNFKSFSYKIPGDISSSAFFIVLTLLSKNSQIVIKNININDTRIGIVKILNKMNAKIRFINIKYYKGEKIADIKVKSCKKIKPIKCPEYLNSSAIDEFMLIFLIAAKANGISTFKNLGELNKKESPRLNLSVEFLKKVGIKVLRQKDNIKIYGKPDLFLKGEFKMKNFMKDHRIFMMSCIAALSLGGKWTIEDKDSIKTSFPKFLHILKELGAKIN